MQTKDKWLLRLSAAWSIYVWSVLIKNMIKDREHSVRFRLVHIGLGTISTSFAVLTWKIAAKPRLSTNSD
ncbi:MAG: hypothetical protein MP439_07870 [Ferrimicrobium sp.]|jgi:hypothetical protein|nr:hypothetical protein [Ferrimicrobium sp.]